ncbi:MAG TPA: hypothetical protein VH619_06130 [Verrucomicrobiae bacterium]|jgi:hypothetical protein|nr:hypothetical protein [Verrucomicrobiae bacterium]
MADSEALGITFRSGVINLETIFGFVGVALTIAFVAWILPTS